MQVQSILNRVQKDKSFIYEKVEWAEEAEPLTLAVQIRPPRNRPAAEPWRVRFRDAEKSGTE